MKQPPSSHPGPRIKALVIPKGMSVTKAAELMGVSRPALSNLLNGNASMSGDMAARLEKTFNYPRAKLLEMQAQHEADEARATIAPAAAKPYVPAFLAIRANQIEQWASHSIPARSRFAVLLRTLVHSTARALEKVDFPGNDDAERPGWDGLVVAGEGTPWVPAGRSGWEFGTNDDATAKATSDYHKSVKATTPAERRATTFVFVTPRRWTQKSAWTTRMNAKSAWKDVRAYDASDLEQWLEHSLPGQVWFAGETNLPYSGVRTLEKCWVDWANVATPPLVPSLFDAAVESARERLTARLKAPSDGPTLIEADSAEEGLAFIAQLLGGRGGEELLAYSDRVLVFDQPGIVPRLVTGTSSIIPVAHTREVERELALHANAGPSIVIGPRNMPNATPHVVLEPVGYEIFDKALHEMGRDRDQIARLTNESGRSLTVLRRRLATVPAVRTPQWAANSETATSLVPVMLVGAWHADNSSDTLALSLLAGDVPYAEIEKTCQRLAAVNDSPVWSIGTYRGVVSKIDLLHAIQGFVTPDDLARYFSIARMVLGEDDPALDLEESQRWAAAIHGKRREFSSAFRNAISDTLVLLAVYGVHLFRKRLGVDTEVEAASIVRDLLPTPLTTRVLEASDRDLPTYAEAAPEAFLAALEQDLRKDEPAVFGLLRPVGVGLLGHPSRTGLLWALESLSWSPKTLPRAAMILARLAEVELNDNWLNKPIHSLAAIFRCWMPQTAAHLTTRVALLRQLAKHFPQVAWKICMQQLGTQGGIGHYSHKPRWRPDGLGFGDPPRTWGPIVEFRRSVLDIALRWNEHTVATLGDLIDRLRALDVEHQAAVWSLIDAWAAQANDGDKATLRERLRVSLLSRRAALRSRGDVTATSLSSRANTVYKLLEPADLLNRHSWLFRDTWVEEAFDDTTDPHDQDFSAHAKRIERARSEALREVLAERGLAGLVDLARRGRAQWSIGFLAGRELLATAQLAELMKVALTCSQAEPETAPLFRELVAGAARSITSADELERAFWTATEGREEADATELLTLFPFARDTWRLVDKLGERHHTGYWQNAVPRQFFDADDECIEAVERLLKARRPRAAFSCVRFYPMKIDELLLFRLLSDLVRGGDERPGEYLLESYSIEEAFKHLDRSQVTSTDQKAALELAFIDLLAPGWTRGGNRVGIPNLERYVETNPDLFVRAVTWAYRRADHGNDPEEYQVSPDRREDMAERGYKLLEALHRIPGRDANGVLTVDGLAEWCRIVRESAAALGRSEIADNCLGALLSNASIGSDGVWPCEVVREVLEQIQSERMVSGVRTGVYNARGVHERGPGGDQERELAEKYRKWGEALQVTHPFVSARLLMRLSETYEREGAREDTEAALRRRLH